MVVKRKECSCPSIRKCACEKPWLASFRLGGAHTPQVDRSFRTKPEAEKFQRDSKSAWEAGTWVDPKLGKTPFAELWKMWLSGGRTDLASNSKDTYASIYKNHFEPNFGKKPVNGIRPTDIANWLMWEKERGFIAYGIEGRAKVLASVFNYAIKLRLIRDNPCVDVSPRQKDKKTSYRPVKDEDVPSAEEFRRIIDAMKPRLQVCGWLMGGAGLRPGEALAASLDSISLERHEIVVDHKLDPKGIQGDDLKFRNGAMRGAKHRDEDDVPRRPPLVAAVEKAIQRHIQEFGTWGDRRWLCESPKFPGRHPTYQFLLDDFTAACDAACPGKGYTPKGFRHFFVTQLINRGVPPFEIAEYVGHTTTQVTEEVYAHFLAETRDRRRTTLGDWLEE